MGKGYRAPWRTQQPVPPRLSTTLTRPSINLQSLRGNREVADWLDQWLELLSTRLPPTPGEPSSLFPEGRLPASPGRLLPDQKLTLSGLDEGLVEQAHHGVGHTSEVLQSENQNPGRTAARVLGDAAYGAYLAAFNGVEPSQWRAGLRIFLPAYIDPNPRHANRARAVGARRPTSPSDPLPFDDWQWPKPYWSNSWSADMIDAKVSIAMRGKPMLVRIPGHLGAFMLSPEAIRYFSELLRRGYGSNLDLRKIDFEIVNFLEPPRNPLFDRRPREIAEYVPAVKREPIRRGSLGTVVIRSADWKLVDGAVKVATVGHELVHPVQIAKIGVDAVYERAAQEAVGPNGYDMDDEFLSAPFKFDPTDPTRPLELMAERMAYEIMKNSLEVGYP